MKILKYIRSHTFIASAIALFAIIVMVIAGRMSNQNKDGDTSGLNTKQVVLIEAQSFRDDVSTVSADGIVESVAQVDIKSQVAAPLSGVYVSVGDNVRTGQVLAELQNADIRAQLDQAKANLNLIQGQDPTGSGDSIRRSTVDKIRETYQKVDDVINTQLAQFIYTGNTSQSQLQQSLTEWRLADDLSARWYMAENTFRVWKKSVDTLSDKSTKEEIDAVLKVSQVSLSDISALMSVISLAINNRTQNALPTDLPAMNAWSVTITNARSTVSSSISAITSAGASLANTQAQVAGAEAGVKNLEAQLAKTIIIAPISGKIAELPLRTGEFASPGQLITTIVGGGGLQVKAYVSGEDLDKIKKGASATIQGNIAGTVTSVAPSLSQLNKKVQVKILINSQDMRKLVIGQNVSVKIRSTDSATKSSSLYILPIQNIKIIPGSAYVYTIDAESKVVKNEVVLGEVKGDFVEVKSGLTDDMKIISPVYGLEEGEKVRTE